VKYSSPLLKLHKSHSHTPKKPTLTRGGGEGRDDKQGQNDSFSEKEQGFAQHRRKIRSPVTFDLRRPARGGTWGGPGGQKGGADRTNSKSGGIGPLQYPALSCYFWIEGGGRSLLKKSFIKKKKTVIWLGREFSLFISASTAGSEGLS